MTGPSGRRWLGTRGLTGGLAMFVTEALVVVALVAVAWLISAVVLAIL